MVVISGWGRGKEGVSSGNVILSTVTTVNNNVIYLKFVEKDFKCSLHKKIW